MDDAERQLARSLEPARQEDAVKWLVELKMLTRSRALDEDDETASLAAYLGRLSAYPADVVRYVLHSQAEWDPWWPAWATLKERLDGMTAPRRELARALDDLRRLSDAPLLA